MGGTQNRMIRKDRVREMDQCALLAGLFFYRRWKRFLTFGEVVPLVAGVRFRRPKHRELLPQEHANVAAQPSATQVAHRRISD